MTPRAPNPLSTPASLETGLGETLPGRNFKTFAQNILFILSVILLSAWIISAYMEVKAGPETFHSAEAVPEVDAVVVPGASVFRSGQLSPVLLQRMDAALKLALLRPGIRLVVSGHDVPQGYSETKAMRDYATAHGFPAKQLLSDDEGRSTFLTLLNCKNRFGIKRAAIVSQAYHLPRALYIARRLGMKGYGLEVEIGKSEPSWHFREWASRFKDFVLVRVFRYFHAN